MKSSSVFLGLWFSGVLAFAVPAMAQQNNCADCHVSRPDAPNPGHFADWDHSAHSSNNVGCEKCHGGDPSTFESFPAHRGVLNSVNPASPVNWRNVSTTCGGCHAGPFVAFQNSQHFALLQKGDEKLPVCTTCHSAAGSLRPSGKALEAECRQCHGPKGIAPRVERAEAARTMYDALYETRGVLKSARSMVNRVNDKTRRAQLEEAYQQAEVPLIEAVQAGHEFQYDNLKERLAIARQRLEALLGLVANPKP